MAAAAGGDFFGVVAAAQGARAAAAAAAEAASRAAAEAEAAMRAEATRRELSSSPLPGSFPAEWRSLGASADCPSAANSAAVAAAAAETAMAMAAAAQRAVDVAVLGRTSDEAIRIGSPTNVVPRAAAAAATATTGKPAAAMTEAPAFTPVYTHGVYEEGEASPPPIADPAQATSDRPVIVEESATAQASQTVMLSEFRVHFGEEVGAGSFGSVYAADHVPSGTPCVVKVMSKSRSAGQTAYFRKEVQALSVLSHPLIPRLFGFFEDEELLYIVMERRSGEEAFASLERRPRFRLSEGEARLVFFQLVSSVAHCHARGVVHRDIKLENVLVEPETLTVALIDFGLCSLTAPDEAGRLMCADFCGSLDYAAPEVVRKERACDGAAADVWSLGTVLFILLFGVTPFNRKHRNQALRDKTEHPPILFPPNHNCHPTVVDLIANMLHPDPERRVNISGILLHPWLAPARDAQRAGLFAQYTRLAMANAGPDAPRDVRDGSAAQVAAEHAQANARAAEEAKLAQSRTEAQAEAHVATAAALLRQQQQQQQQQQQRRAAEESLRVLMQHRQQQELQQAAALAAYNAALAAVAATPQPQQQQQQQPQAAMYSQ